jgi:hypothetical protein
MLADADAEDDDGDATPNMVASGESDTINSIDDPTPHE